MGSSHRPEGPGKGALRPVCRLPGAPRLPGWASEAEGPAGDSELGLQCPTLGARAPALRDVEPCVLCSPDTGTSGCHGTPPATAPQALSTAALCCFAKSSYHPRAVYCLTSDQGLWLGSAGAGCASPRPARPALTAQPVSSAGESRGQHALGRGTGLLVGAVTEKVVSLHCLGHSPEGPTSPAVALEHSQKWEVVCESVSGAVDTPGTACTEPRTPRRRLQH